MDLLTIEEIKEMPLLKMETEYVADFIKQHLDVIGRLEVEFRKPSEPMDNSYFEEVDLTIEQLKELSHPQVYKTIKLISSGFQKIYNNNLNMIEIEKSLRRNQFQMYKSILISELSPQLCVQLKIASSRLAIDLILLMHKYSQNNPNEETIVLISEINAALQKAFKTPII